MQKSKNFLNYPLKIIFMFTLIGGVLFFLTPKGTDFDGPLRLAHQMLIGKFYLPESLSWMEHYDRDGHFYIAYPPMVSLVLTPFVFVLKDWVTQPGINTLLVFCSSILLYLFVRSLRALRPVAWVASVFFVFGTTEAYTVTRGDVWLLMQNEGIFFLLLALCSLRLWRSFFWCGFFFVTAALCRHALFAGVLVLPYFFTTQGSLYKKVLRYKKGVFLIVLGGILPLTLALVTQHFMTGDAFVSPYTVGWKQWGNMIPKFGFRYVEVNLKFYLTSLPTFLHEFPFVKFDDAGQTIFFMSPVFFGFLGLVTGRLSFSWVRGLVTASICVFVFYLFYHWNGYSQLGSRYMQDIFPLMIPLALLGFYPYRGFRKGLLFGFLSISIAINMYALYLKTYFGK